MASLKRKRLAKALRARYGVSKGPWFPEDSILDDIYAGLAEIWRRSKARQAPPPTLEKGR